MGRDGISPVPLKLPSRTARLRLTMFYGGLFALSGVVLLTITYVLASHFTNNIQITTEPVTRGGSLHGRPVRPSPRPFAAVTSQLHHSYLHQLLVGSGIALAITTVVSLWFGWLIAGRVLRPVRTMTARTRRISQENLHERLNLPGPPDELKDLGDTIDSLLGRLETAFEAQRRFVANVSHELRTPLAMMRTSLDVTAGKPQGVPREVTVLATKVREGLDQADRLIENFLTLARAQQSLDGDVTATSLSGLAASAVAACQGRAAALDISLRPEIAPVAVAGNPTLLRRAVENLLDNALRYNQSGGYVYVGCHYEPRTAKANVIVENSGPRLDGNQVEQLGQPFRRLTVDRTGDGSLGLGLSIVAAIAAAHHGALHLSPRAPGGLRAVIELPLARRSVVQP